MRICAALVHVGRPCGEIMSMMSRCHADLVGSTFAGLRFLTHFTCKIFSFDSYIFSSCCVLFNAFISKIQNLCYICSPPLRHLFLSSHLLTDLTSYLLSLLLSSHLFLYLLHHFYILNHQKLKFMFYIYKLNIYIFLFLALGPPVV